jgi:hypothetical protein
MASKMGRVVRLVRDRTNSNELDWQTTARKGVYQTAFPDMAIQARQRANADFPQIMDVVIAIQNEEGETVEEVTGDDLSGDFDNPNRVLEEIYEGARRQALGVDSALDSLLEYLSDEDSAGGTDR